MLVLISKLIVNGVSGISVNVLRHVAMELEQRLVPRKLKNKMEEIVPEHQMKLIPATLKLVPVSNDIYFYFYILLKLSEMS